MLPLSSIRQNALQYAIAKEQATSLGRVGRRVQEALDAWRNAPDDQKTWKTKLLYAAADAVWRYFVQREALGFNNHDLAVEEYAIPKEVMKLVGVRPPKESTSK